jgi:ribosomal protein S27AE
MSDRLFDERPVCKRCGHLLAEHSSGLDCRTCKQECGLDASRWYQR